MHMFRRGRLKNLVSLLSGRDFNDKTFKDEIAKDSFDKLNAGVMNFMNEHNFKQFVLAIRSAGFISSKLLNSQTTIDFAYTLFLILQNSGEVQKTEIKRYIQKWFVLSTLTGRYVSSPESQMDRDLRAITSKGIVEFLREQEEALLSDTFWDVALVQNLETTATNSPFFNTFIAAQVYNGEKSLLSNSSKVSDLILVAGDVHHIFPKGYLRDNGIESRSVYNQVANYTYLDTPVNIAVGKKPPNVYFSEAINQCTAGEIVTGTITDTKELSDNLHVNCIPNGIESMTADDFQTFLKLRRSLMAKKIKNYYYSL